MSFIHCNGVRLYYELHGREDAPALILNNGILMNAAASWTLQTCAFAERFRILQYDCRGQGLSDHPDGPYSMLQHADDLAALVDALAIERAHVLGISYGGEVAQAFALAHPRRVRSLILADTVSEVGPELKVIVEGWKAAARVGDPDLFFLVTVPWNFSPEFIAARAGILQAARVRYGELDLPSVARLCDAFLGVDFTARLGEIAVPTCVIVGERDLLKPPRYAEVIHRSIRGSVRHVLPGAGHATCVEAPSAFNAIVLNFLAGVEADSGRPPRNPNQEPS
jgi:3-oxoadipate enol-lactonase